MSTEFTLSYVFIKKKRSIHLHFMNVYYIYNTLYTYKPVFSSINLCNILIREIKDNL